MFSFFVCFSLFCCGRSLSLSRSLSWYTHVRTFAKSKSEQITTICAHGFFQRKWNSTKWNQKINMFHSWIWWKETRIPICTIATAAQKNEERKKKSVASKNKSSKTNSRSRSSYTNINNNDSYNSKHQQYEYLWLNVAIEILDQIAVDIMCVCVRCACVWDKVYASCWAEINFWWMNCECAMDTQCSYCKFQHALGIHLTMSNS